MTVDEFFGKYNNTPITDYSGQCVAVYDEYCKDVIGAPIIPVVGAKDIYGKYPKDYFDEINNTPEGVPQKGDVVIWGTDIGPFGHVAIFNDGDANTFTSFDQNFPIGSICHFQHHDYTGVIGWLHPKPTNIPQTGVMVDSVTYTNLVTKSTNCDVIASYFKLDSLDKTCGNIVTSKVEDLKKQLADCQAKVNTPAPSTGESGQPPVPPVHPAPPPNNTGSNGSNPTSVGTPPVAPSPPNPQVQTPPQGLLQRFFKWLFRIK